MDLTDLEFRPVPAGGSPARELIAAMVSEASELYGRALDAPGTPSATPGDFTPPRGVYVAAYAGNVAVAGGGIKHVVDGTGEVKRMYVVPAARSRGVARALLAALEDAARGLGYARLRLDTGPSQPHARELYVSAGYREIADYNGNPYATFWGEKDLSPQGR